MPRLRPSCRRFSREHSRTDRTPLRPPHATSDFTTRSSHHRGTGSGRRARPHAGRLYRVTAVVSRPRKRRTPPWNRRTPPRNRRTPPNPAGAAAQGPNPLRNVYFGDLHTQHQLLVRRVPQRHAGHPRRRLPLRAGRAAGPTRPASRSSSTARWTSFAVTDHASFLGMLPAMLDPEQAVSRHPDSELARSIASGELTGAERGAAYGGHPRPHPRHPRGTDRHERRALRVARDHRRGRAPQRFRAASPPSSPTSSPAAPRTRTCTAT